MNVLEINELVDFLENEFGNMEFDLEDLILKKIEIGEKEVERIMGVLKLKDLPIDFISLVTRYDFSNYTILASAFGYKREDNLNWILDKNTDHLGFYGDYFRNLHQNNFIVVANGDPYTILLDSKSGEVYAITDERSLANKLKVADSFTEFLRLSGTVFYAVRKEKTKDFLQEIKEDTILYWKTILG